MSTPSSLKARLASLEKGRDRDLDPAKVCWLIGEIEAGRQIGDGREERAAKDLVEALREIERIEGIDR